MCSTRFLSSLLLVILVHAVPITDGDGRSCNVQIYSSYECSATVSTSRSCQASHLSVANSSLVSCKQVSMFWSYPMNNLTMTIETPFTQGHQQYTISVDNHQLMGAISHVYRVLNNKETEVTTTSPQLILNSDSNYQIILKVVAPPELMYYGVFIKYDVFTK